MCALELTDAQADGAGALEQPAAPTSQHLAMEPGQVPTSPGDILSI
jgi:hypothetical protein